ncbi:MAG: VWA domain-containing protein [Chloroflexi bacterium]|nr:VWA domain-containing protein [Chloroflexota bacterium]
MRRPTRPAGGNNASRTWWLIGAAALLVVCLACGFLGYTGTQFLRTPNLAQTPEPVKQSATITVAVSPEKVNLIQDLAGSFNALKQKSDDGLELRVIVVPLNPDDGLEQALQGKFEAVNPDSSLWLNELDRTWLANGGRSGSIVGETRRYAVSPVVVAMWGPVAQGLGYPGKSIGWNDLLNRAKTDANFKWSHPSAATASGLLATLAEFYAAAGKTRGLTTEDVSDPKVVDFVGQLEKTVRYYGEGEQTVIDRAAKEGPAFLDAFIVQEFLVVGFNRQNKQHLVAIYPQEGTLWADHPLALLEIPTLSNNQRLAFNRFRFFLLTPEVQKRILAAGLRPADTSIPIDGPDSPLTAANGVNRLEPRTTLQIPGNDIVDQVRQAWLLTKRKTNVYLVVDTSGSMAGEKLRNAQDGLKGFLDQIKGDTEHIGLIRFSTRPEELVPLREIGLNRRDLQVFIDTLQANGETALLDGVSLAYDRLQAQNDPTRINAIVVMTDGRENASKITLSRLQQHIGNTNGKQVPVVIFCIAYGKDADYKTLNALAGPSGGQVREGTTETIRSLYRLLSTYF